MRHVLVHDYYQISDEMVWATIQTELYPLKEKVIVTHEPCYEVKVYLENNDTFTTSINACKQHVFDYYIGKTFNMGMVEDVLQRVAWVEIVA